MAEVEDPQAKQEKRSRYEENVPSSKILKLAIVAALIIVVIALVLYLRARHQPPALRNQLQVTPMRVTPVRFNSAQLSATNSSPNASALPPGTFQEPTS